MPNVRVSELGIIDVGGGLADLVYPEESALRQFDIHQIPPFLFRWATFSLLQRAYLLPLLR